MFKEKIKIIFIFSLGLGILFQFSSGVVHGYVPIKTDGGDLVLWSQGSHLNLVGNSQNQSGLSDRDIFYWVSRTLQKWGYASNGAIQFNYWQGTDLRTYRTEDRFNGWSNIYFASAPGAETQALTDGVLALTQVWFNPDTGKILETDIILNDRDYELTGSPKDTSGEGSGQNGEGFGAKIYLESVLTHEIGHAFGLSHSGHIHASMLYRESPDQYHLGCDDQSGIRAHYQSSMGKRGTIKGKVLGPNSQPVTGAHVLAYSTDNGRVVRGAITDTNGKYRFKQLPTGNYSFIVEPFFGGSDVLPPAYGKVDTRICAYDHFSREFYGAEEAGILKQVSLSAGQAITLNNWKVNCLGSRTANLSGQFGSKLFSNPTPVFTSPGETTTLVDLLESGGETLYYDLGTLSGAMEIFSTSHGLYSPLEVDVKLLDSNGEIYQPNLLDSPRYESESGLKSFDGSMKFHSLPLDRYTLVLESVSDRDSRYYPMGSTALDFAPYVVLSLNRSGTSEGGGPKCLQREDFPNYSSPFGPPKRQSNQDGSGFLGCGMIDINAGGHPPGSGAPPLEGFLPLLLSMLLVGSRKIRNLLQPSKVANV